MATKNSSWLELRPAAVYDIISQAERNNLLVTLDSSNYFTDADGIDQHYSGLVIKVKASFKGAIALKFQCTHEEFNEFSSKLDLILSEKFRIEQSGLVSYLNNLTPEQRAFAEIHLLSKKSITFSV